MAFQYRERPAAAWEQRAKSGGDYPGFVLNDFKEYSVRKGENWVRILPPTWEGAEHYGLEVFIHYGIGPEKATVLCLYKMAEMAKALNLSADFCAGKCPICDAKAKAEKKGDKELADELRYNKRILVWMVDLKAEDEGPKVWSMPASLDVNIVKLAIDPRTGEILYIDHHEEGYGISFEKDGEGLKTKYVAVQIDRKASGVDPDFLEFIQGDPLPSVLHWRTAEEVQKLFGGAAGAGAEAGPAERGADDRRREEPRPERGNGRDEGRSSDRAEPAPDKPRFEARGSRREAPREEEPVKDAPRSRPGDERGSRDQRDDINDEVPFTGAQEPKDRVESRAAPDPKADAKSTAADLRSRFRR